MLILFKCYHQRPKKSELSGWQLSAHKNFPDEVRKSFLLQKKRVNRFRNHKVCVNCFCNKKICSNHFCNKKVCVNCIWTKKSVRKSFSRLTRYFPDHPETILTIQNLSRLSGHFPGYPKTFQVSGNFPGNPDTF